MNELEKKNTVPSERQTNQSVFFEGNRSGSPRVMFIGNSITYHEENIADLGWYGNWGMAASSRENDYAHLIMAEIVKKHPNAAFCTVQASTWERTYKKCDYDENFSTAKDFCPDIIICCIGANISNDLFEKEAFKVNIKKLHEYLSGGNNNVRIFESSSFFDNEDNTEAIEEYTKENGTTLVYISDIAKDRDNLAYDKFEHHGVQVHPGDRGMKLMADRFLLELDKVL